MGDALGRAGVGVALSTLIPKENPMATMNPDLSFFIYLVVLVGLCPICARLANQFSK
jgi:hypothetical protein